MKRIFISLGSEGSKALAALIARLCTENMFDKFNDLYIAFDSADTTIKCFQKLKTDKGTPRIQAYTLEINENDHKIEKTFQSSWTATEISAGGVGGKRALSMKAADCFKKVWLDPQLRLDQDLQPDDQIIIVGSAFGGTSTGMFPNVCQYLDLKIREKRSGDQNFRNIVVLGFLLMPEAITCERSYDRMSDNIVDLFSDLQRISWQRRLECTRQGFKVPSWSQYNDNDGFFPLYTGVVGEGALHEYGIAGSSLPLGNLYLIPTPKGQRHLVTDIYAESLFAATYLATDYLGHEAWVDRSGLDLLTDEDKCFAGFNMFAMKSGRTVSIKNSFNKGLISAWHGKDGHGGLGSTQETENTSVQEEIQGVFRKTQISCQQEQYAGLTGNALKLLLKELATAAHGPEQFDKFLENYKKLLIGVKVEASTIDVISALELVKTLGSKEYAGWNHEVNFHLIIEAYKVFHGFVTNEASRVEEYQKKLYDAGINAKKMIDDRIKCRVVNKESAIWGRFSLAQEESVFAEVYDAFRTFFENEFQLYAFACRCAKTKKQFISEDSFKEEMKTLQYACNKVITDAKDNVKRIKENTNPYIAEGVVLDDLQAPQELQFNPLGILLYAACYSDDKEQKQYLEKQEEEFIQKFIIHAAKQPQHADPLAEATIANFATVEKKGTHSSSLKVENSDTYHYHFAIRGGKLPNGFSMKNSDVQEMIPTMPGCQTGTAEFFSCEHNAENPRYGVGESNEAYMGKRFQGKTATVDIQGLWIGTLGIDFEVRQMLQNIYGGVTGLANTWVQRREMRLGQTRTMTTEEMIYFGLIIEAIEEKTREAWERKKMALGQAAALITSHRQNLRVTFNRPRSTPYDLATAHPNQLGFQDDVERSCILERITTTWTKEILDWIRDPSSNGFANQFGTMTRFDSVKNTESHVFNHIRFSLKQQEIDDMNALKAQILTRLEVQV